MRYPPQSDWQAFPGSHAPRTVSLSIVVPCYQESTHILACLAALRASAGERQDVEVLVVDGGSTDGTRELVHPLTVEEPRIRLMCHSRSHTPISLNMGVQHARGEYVAILGAHAMVDVGWIDAVEDALDRHPHAWAVGGVLETIAEGAVGEAISIAQASPIGVGNCRFRTGGQPGYVDTVVFGAYRREVFDRVGGFDEELLRNQDDEFNLRILAAGGRLYFDPTIRCRYYARSSFGRLWRQYYQYGFWKVRVRQKIGRLGSWRPYVPAAFIAGSVLSLLGALGIAGGWLLPFGYLALYAAAIAGGSLLAARGRSQLFPRVGLAAAVMHIAYGLGFWEGMLRWGALRMPLSDNHRALTR
jgi:GT2 family glycosyltransferase